MRRLLVAATIILGFTSLAYAQEITIHKPAAVVVPVDADACTTAGDADCTIVYASTYWLPWPAMTITLRNSGANALSNCLVEWSADNTNWEVWDSTTFATLASGAILSMGISGQSRGYLRIEARSASGTTIVPIVTANRGR